MGKGEEDAAVKRDSCSTYGTRLQVELHLIDDLTSQDLSTLKGCQDQAAFNQAAGQMWGWYDRQAAQWKVQLRASVLAY